MVVLRHLTGSDPSIEVTDEEMGGNSAHTVHFKERRPNAARDFEQDARSVVIHDTAIGTASGGPAEVTQTIRVKREAHAWTIGHLLVWLETRWIAIVIAASLLALLACVAYLRR